MAQQDERLRRIFDAACQLFIVPGYSATKMKDIADAANVAVGSLYSLFESKTALLDFVFSNALNNQFSLPEDLPMVVMPKSTLIKATEASYQSEDTRLFADLQSKNYTFKKLISSLFTIFETYGQYFLILEKNPQISPELLSLYKSARQQLYANVSGFLQAQQHLEQIRPLTEPSYDAMVIIDEIFWWSAHKRYDSFESNQNDYSIKEMQNIVTEQLLSSYMK